MHKVMSNVKIIVILVLTACILSACIIPLSPLENPVVLEPGQAKTFQVAVYPSDATFTWLVDGVVVTGITGGSFAYMRNDDQPSQHTLQVQAHHPDGTSTESYTWNINYTGRKATFQAELVVRSANNFSNHAAVVNLVSLAKAHNIATLVIAAKQDEDDEFASGTVFYPSAIAPQAFAGFDALADVITEAHKAGIKVTAWIPQFHDQVAFNKNSAWRMQSLVNGQAVDYRGSDSEKQEFFVNPLHPEVQDYEISIIQEVVSHYAVDAVVLDWIRFDGWNMDVSRWTRDAFIAAYSYDPATIDFSTENAQRTHWQAWRTSKLADYVRRVRDSINAIKPGLALGVYILPPEFDDVGQDAAKFRDAIDFVAPMCYWKDWGMSTAWVYDGVMVDTRVKVGSGVAMIPTIDISYNNDQYRDINVGIRARHAAVSTIGYFGYGEWTAPDMIMVDTVRRF